MYEYNVNQILKIVDGDTLDILIDVGFNMLRKERVRLNRIDTPESISKDLHEKTLGIEAKQFLESWIKKNKKLTIKTIKDDKYGRILADIFNDKGECINDILIENGYAWVYDGGAKYKDFTILENKRKNS